MMTDFVHKVSLDRQDIRILELLQSDSQISRSDLAERVNLSASQCFRRLKRLEQSGLIERYVALLNRECAGLDVSAMVMVSFSKTLPGARDNVIELVRALDEVQECYSASGEYDFILKVNCPTMKDYSELINQKLLCDSVVSMHSYIFLECLKYSTALPLRTS
ncbi:MAG: Lrp/AsnC family transcriptional regulator [Pseudomonadales bacterium]